MDSDRAIRLRQGNSAGLARWRITAIRGPVAGGAEPRPGHSGPCVPARRRDRRRAVCWNSDMSEWQAWRHGRHRRYGAGPTRIRRAHPAESTRLCWPQGSGPSGGRSSCGGAGVRGCATCRHRPGPDQARVTVGFKVLASAMSASTTEGLRAGSRGCWRIQAQPWMLGLPVSSRGTT